MAKPSPSSSPPINTDIDKYGVRWPGIPGPNGTTIPRPAWMIEQYILENRRKPEIISRIKGYLGDFEHYKRFVTEIWGSDPKGIFYFEWNPNAEEILRRYLQYKILGIAGHGGSGKTRVLALLAVVEFLLDPYNTKCLLTCTNLRAGRGKVWGAVCECWQHASQFFGGEDMMPGRLMAGNSIIRYQYQGVTSESAGLELLPGEQAAAKESSEKLQGYHRGRVLMMGDEWATVARSIHDTALSNLRANPEARLVAGFNPDSHYDSGGAIGRPKDGWSSVTIDDYGWETEVGGYCIHFDGEKSVNVIEGREIWKGLLGAEGMAEMIVVHGKDTKNYYKYVRGWWSPTGSLECIYSEAEFITHGADAPVKTWISEPVMIASLDPAFATGGDRAVASIGKVGIAKDPLTGKTQKVCEKIKTVVLLDDATNKTQSRSEQVVADFHKLLMEYNVRTENVAVDATGGGDPFSALLARDIGTGFLMVQFKGSPSDLPVSRNDKRPGTERFANKVSELWYVGKELVRTGQIKGLDPDTINEFTIRTYKETGGRVQIEPKEKMKQRTGGKKSPDRADSCTLLWEVARQRHGLSSTEKAAAKPPSPQVQKTIFEQTYDLSGYKEPKKVERVPLQEAGFYEAMGGGWADY